MNGEPSGAPAVDDLTVRNNTELHRFEAVDPEGGVVGYLGYDLVPPHVLSGKGMFVAVHTSVEPEMEGRGVAARLTRAALEHARAQHLTVIAECPYVHAFIDRNPEYQDLVP